MNFPTLGGFLAGWAIVIYVMMEKDLLGYLWNTEAFLLVIGGTMTCAFIGFPLAIIKRAGRAFLLTYTNVTFNAEKTIEYLMDVAVRVRREGLLSIQEEVEKQKDPFLKAALKMLVDNLDDEVVNDTLENEIDFMSQRHGAASLFFNTMGSYAPTFGLTGTLMGLIVVLANISDASKLGTGMAVAIVATFYGIFVGNFIFVPTATKLVSLNEEEVVFKKCIIQGVLSMKHNEVPYVTRTKLEAFLDNATKNKRAAKDKLKDKPTTA